MPFFIALAASAALHLAVLLSPGWALPFDDESEPAMIDATLVMPARSEAKSEPAKSAPQPIRRPRPKPTAPTLPATPLAPLAHVPGEVPGEPAVPAPEPPLDAPAQPKSVAAAAEPAPGLVPAAPPAPSFHGRWPRAGRIVFEVTRGEGFIVGRSEHHWQHDGERYVLHAESETTGVAALFRPAKVIQESRGGFDAGGLRPQEFDVLREGRAPDTTRFDADQRVVVFGRGQRAPYVPAQDMLSLFYQFSTITLDVPQFTVTVATGRKLAAFAVKVEEPAPFDTPLGARQAWHVRIAGTASEEATELWLDAESHLPLKIRYRDRKGEVFDQIATFMDVDTPE